jgi:acyl-CoA-binding protein
MGTPKTKELKPMALKTVIESTEGLNEALIPFYTETDGKFVLQLEGVKQHPDVLNLSNAYETVKADRNTIREERDTLKSGKVDLPEGFTLEKWEKLKDGKADEAALIALRQELEAERDDFKAKYETATAQAHKNALDRDLTDALTEAGVTNPSFAKAARNMLSDGVQIGTDGKPFVDTDMGPLALTDHVKRWASGEGKDFVTPPQGGGSKGGSDGGKPNNNPLMDKVPQLADLPES